MGKQLKKRQIIHVDMDAFYASVEQRDRRELQGKPVVVGGDPRGRGVASTCSYEARKYGIRSAMPLSEAKRRCPHAIFLPVDMPKYQDVSSQIHRIFQCYTPLIEPLSLDEAFLDVTDSIRLFGTGEKIAREIKLRIKEELQLTASVGLAPNKFLAKLASDIQKPDGLVIINEDEIQSFLDPLPIERIWGVGPKTAKQLHQLNITTIKELRTIDEVTLIAKFGSVGSQLFRLCRGIDDRPVEPDREVKSIGREITFSQDQTDREVLQTFMLELSADVGRRLRRESLKARTIIIKVRYTDFSTVSRSKTLDVFTNLDKDIFREACLLLQKFPLNQSVRLIGITVHNLSGKMLQQSIFDAGDSNNDILTKTMDTLKDRFGEDSITLARLLRDKRNSTSN